MTTYFENYSDNLKESNRRKWNVETIAMKEIQGFRSDHLKQVYDEQAKELEQDSSRENRGHVEVPEPLWKPKLSDFAVNLARRMLEMT